MHHIFYSFCTVALVTLWCKLNPLTPTVPVIFDNLTLRAERQSARMSKIANDDLARSGTGCFIAVPLWQQWAGHQRVNCVVDFFNIVIFTLLPCCTCVIVTANETDSRCRRGTWTTEHDWLSLVFTDDVRRGDVAVDSLQLRWRPRTGIWR